MRKRIIDHVQQGTDTTRGLVECGGACGGRNHLGGCRSSD